MVKDRCFFCAGKGGAALFTEEQLKIGQWVREISAKSYRGWKAFYHTTKWKYKRKDILKRDHNECQMCLQKGKYTRATTVHHIKHLRDMPELALTDSNLISLCNDCHELMHPEKHKRKIGYENKERW